MGRRTIHLIPGLIRSPNGFFSDLGAQGLRDSSAFQHADVAAGICWILALTLRGPIGADGLRRQEWRWLIAFAIFGIVGGLFVYACPEGTSSVCRSLEWHFELPLHHHLLAIAGNAEFASLSIALGPFVRRTRVRGGRRGRVAHLLFVILLACYPVLGLAYLTDRLGALGEPIFFVLFTSVIALELIEPEGSPPGVNRTREVDLRLRHRSF